MTITYRRFEAKDRAPVYALFRESIWDYMLQHGLVAIDDKIDVDATFELQKNLYIHLEKTAIEDWVAEDNKQGLVGWALDNDYKIDPFHEILLAKNPTMQFDRYIMTESAFVW